jgi:hypothetical protein
MDKEPQNREPEVLMVKADIRPRPAWADTLSG